MVKIAGRETAMGGVAAMARSTTPKRGRTAAERNDIEACGVPLPRIVIRMVPVPQQVDGASADAPPMFYPNRAKGRQVLAGVLQAMMNLQGVYALAAVRVLQGTRGVSDPVGQVENVCARSLKYLLEIGRAQLVTETGFDTEEQLAAWAARPTHAFRIPTAELGRNPMAFRDAVLVPIRMLSVAVSRVERVLAAVHRTQLLSNDDVEAALAEAFSKRPPMSAWDCYRVATFADIAPGSLWRAHAHHTDLFELGRFVGRIDRGVKAVLAGPRLASMEQALSGGAGDTDDIRDIELRRMHADIRDAIAAHFGVARFRGLTQRAVATASVITVDRQTRNLRCRADVGREARLRGR